MPNWTALVTLAALMLYTWMSAEVSRARGRSGLKAPATTGDPEFERVFRVHVNTLEWMPLFLAPLWLTAFYVGDRTAAVLGLVWIAGRFLYMRAYAADAAKRGQGYAIQALAAGALVVVAFAGIIRAMLG